MHINQPIIVFIPDAQKWRTNLFLRNRIRQNTCFLKAVKNMTKKLGSKTVQNHKFDIFGSKSIAILVKVEYTQDAKTI